MAGESPIRKLPPMAAGQRYGRLVAIEYVKTVQKGIALWRFQCDCGNTHVTRASGARYGSVRSCGCFTQEQRAATGRRKTTHGMCRTPEYRSWRSMLTRCLNPKADNYPRYGGRGIKVSDRWLKFESFLADMGRRPSPKHTLERIENDRGYEPGNTEWATRKTQARNRSSNRLVTYQGREMILIEACELAGADYVEVYRKITKGGLTIEQALSKKVAR